MRFRIKDMLRYMWRDKVDLGMFLVVLAGGVQWFIWGEDLTPICLVFALYTFGVMHRVGVAMGMLSGKITTKKK